DHAVQGRVESPRFPRLERVIRLRGPAPETMLAWDALASAADAVSFAQLADVEASLSPDDPINLQYTSGTTGYPRGALLTHRNLLVNAFYIAKCQALTEADRICIPVPLYHCF